MGRDRAAEHEGLDWDEVAPGWKKWDGFLMGSLKPVGEKILDMARLERGYSVLDVATGSGEPGLSAARRVANGRVVGLDVSREMVRTARSKARSLGLANYSPRWYAGGRFPFGDARFDAVISRFGIMFFPDILGGVKEMARVLKTGRRIAVAVWGPQNPTAKSISERLNASLGLPPPDPDEPGPFRCSKSGSMASAMLAAGLKRPVEKEVWTRRSYASPEEYAEYIQDLNPAMADAIREAGEKGRKAAMKIVREELSQVEHRDGRLTLPAVARVTSGTK